MGGRECRYPAPPATLLPVQVQAAAAPSTLLVQAGRLWRPLKGGCAAGCAPSSGQPSGGSVAALVHRQRLRHGDGGKWCSAGWQQPWSSGPCAVRCTAARSSHRLGQPRPRQLAALYVSATTSTCVIHCFSVIWHLERQLAGWQSCRFNRSRHAVLGATAIQAEICRRASSPVRCSYLRPVMPPGEGEGPQQLRLLP